MYKDSVTMKLHDRSTLSVEGEVPLSLPPCAPAVHVCTASLCSLSPVASEATAALATSLRARSTVVLFLCRRVRCQHGPPFYFVVLIVSARPGLERINATF